MKALPKLLRLTLFGISLTSLFPVQPAEAYMMTILNVGSNVVATGSGAFNLTGLTFLGHFQSEGALINAGSGVIFTGPGDTKNYLGLTGPGSFGTAFARPNRDTGDTLGIGAFEGLVIVPYNYVSGDPLTNSMIFNNTNLLALGLRPGTYVWRWGTGLPNQKFTLQIGRVVPDSGSTVSLLGCALLGLAVLRRKLNG